MMGPKNFYVYQFWFRDYTLRTIAVKRQDNSLLGWESEEGGGN
jgi:hypothetical protein